MRRAILAFAASFLLFPAIAAAQQGSAELRGQVVDQQGAVLPGVAIVVRNQETGQFREAVSSADGSFFLTGLVPGFYQVEAELEGFKRSTLRDIRLEVGKTLGIEVRLEIGGLQEPVTVSAESPIVDVSSKEVGGNIANRELIDLPSINRNYIGFIGLLPGVVPNISTESFGSDSISVNGQDPRNNNYALDGANNNDDVIGQRAGTQARTPLESVQEFQVLTNQFDAEFGQTMGAVINAVTKQGTNQFRGSAFGYVQDAGLTAESYFVKKNNLPKPDTTQQQYGGTFGGPVVRDKAHFFFSLERVIIDDGRDINIPARPELNDSTTTQTRVWNTLIRFDHQINANHTWAVRWLREYSPQFNQIITPPAVTLAAAREEDDLDQTVVGTINSVFGANKLNVLRLGFTQEDVAFATAGYNGNGHRQDLLPPLLRFLTFDDQQSTVAQARVNNAYQFEDTFSWFVPDWHGDHDFKAGLQYKYVSADSVADDTLNGMFTFSSNGPYDPNNFRTYPERLTIRVPSGLTTYMKAHFGGVFFQDKWRWNDRLTLSLGARYDLEIIPFQEVDNPEFSDPGDYPVDTNNLSPRVGFSYDLAGDGRSVLRGGYGLFYDKTHFELISAIMTAGVYSTSFNALFPANSADPGPSQGQRPTNPLLANGPTVNRALLEQLYPPGSRVKNTGTVFFDSPDRRLPYTHQFSAGFERQLAPTVSASVDFVHAMGRNMFMSFDENAGLRTTTSRTAPIVRPNRDFVGQVLQRINIGETDYDALMFQLEKRFSRNHSFRAAYTWSNSRGNTSGNGIPQSNFQLLEDMRLDLNEGPTDFDRHHNFVVSGMVLVPKTGGLTVSAVARALSGLPFTIQDTTTDGDRNGLLFDPLPAGEYSGTGSDAITVDNDGGRNGAYGPGFFQLDMRLGYRLRLGGSRTLDLFGEIFNVTNRANFDNPTGDRRLTNFLVLTALRPGGVPTTGQVGVRFAF